MVSTTSKSQVALALTSTKPSKTSTPTPYMQVLVCHKVMPVKMSWLASPTGALTTPTRFSTTPSNNNTASTPPGTNSKPAGQRQTASTTAPNTPTPQVYLQQVQTPPTFTTTERTVRTLQALPVAQVQQPLTAVWLMKRSFYLSPF